jgi:hypothetical protein
MAEFQNEFNHAVHEQHQPAKVLQRLIRRVFKKQNASVGDAEFEGILAEVNEAIKVKSDIWEFKFGSDDRTRSLNITIAAEDMDQALSEYLAEFDEQLDAMLESMTKSIAQEMLEILYKDLPNQLRHIRQTERRFERRLARRWKGVLDRFAMLICVAHESAEIYLTDMNQPARRQASRIPNLSLSIGGSVTWT